MVPSLLFLDNNEPPTTQHECQSRKQIHTNHLLADSYRAGLDDQTIFSMKAKDLIKILVQHPELEVGLIEFGKYEDNIPMLSIHSVELVLPDEDQEQFIGINFITSGKA